MQSPYPATSRACTRGGVIEFLQQIRAHHVVQRHDAAPQVQRQQRHIVQPLRTVRRVQIIETPQPLQRRQRDRGLLGKDRELPKAPRDHRPTADPGSPRPFGAPLHRAAPRRPVERGDAALVQRADRRTPARRPRSRRGRFAFGSCPRRASAAAAIRPAAAPAARAWRRIRSSDGNAVAQHANRLGRAHLVDADARGAADEIEPPRRDEPRASVCRLRETARDARDPRRRR